MIEISPFDFDAYKPARMAGLAKRAELVPVTLGNIVGGAGFVAATYWFCYLRAG